MIPLKLQKRRRPTALYLLSLNYEWMANRSDLYCQTAKCRPQNRQYFLSSTERTGNTLENRQRLFCQHHRRLTGLLLLCAVALGPTLFLVPSFSRTHYSESTTNRPFDSTPIVTPTPTQRPSIAPSPDPAQVCDDECTRFRQLVQVNWPADRQKAAIYYLAYGPRLNVLNTGLRSLDDNFNNLYQYPIIIFYEESDLNFSVDAVRRFTWSPLFFQKVRFEIPSFVNRTNVPAMGCYGRFPIGYRHMCRFHARVVYEQAIFSGLQYLWRLDDDSEILRPINYDIFEYMVERNLQYGYIKELTESGGCMEGLLEAVDFYINNASILPLPQLFQERPKNRIFYNNFEVSELAFWQSAPYKKFVDYIDRLGGIYYHRWGDANIKTIAVSLFAEKKRVHRFRDIAYNHNELGF